MSSLSRGKISAVRGAGNDRRNFVCCASGGNRGWIVVATQG